MRGNAFWPAICISKLSMISLVPIGEEKKKPPLAFGTGASKINRDVQ